MFPFKRKHLLKSIINMKYSSVRHDSLKTQFLFLKNSTKTPLSKSVLNVKVASYSMSMGVDTALIH